MLVSWVGAEKQIVLHSSYKTNEDTQPTEFSLKDSFCRHVHGMDFHLVIDDSPSHPLIKDNPMVKSNDIGAYAGFPIHGKDDKLVAILCALFDRMHRWSGEDQEAMKNAAPDRAELLAGALR